MTTSTTDTFPPVETFLPATVVNQTLSAVLAVEKAAAELSGSTKQQIVLGSVLNGISVGVAAAPQIISLITQFVALMNSFGFFTKKK